MSRRLDEGLRRHYHSGIRALKRTIPANAWPHLAARIYPWLKPTRRGAAVWFDRASNGIWRARYRGFDEHIAFYEPRRAERMIWPGGPQGAVKGALHRYRDQHCRVLPGDVVVDIGANIGEFSIMVSEIASTVIAVEGDPTPFRCLVENAATFDRIAPIKAVLGAAPGTQKFYLASSTADSSLVQPHARSHSRSVTVSTLDDVVFSRGYERIDFLKLDAEGAEPEVLAGGQRTLSGCRAVVVDAGPERRGDSTEEPVSLILRDAGFDISSRNHVIFAMRRSATSPGM